MARQYFSYNLVKPVEKFLPTLRIPPPLPMAPNGLPNGLIIERAFSIFQLTNVLLTLLSFWNELVCTQEMLPHCKKNDISVFSKVLVLS